MQTVNIQSPVNGNLSSKREDNVTLSNSISTTNSNNGLYKNLVVQGNSNAFRNTTVIRTNQGHFLLLATQPVIPATVGGISFTQNNLTGPIQLAPMVNSVDVSSVLAVSTANLPQKTLATTSNGQQLLDADVKTVSQLTTTTTNRNIHGVIHNVAATIGVSTPEPSPPTAANREQQFEVDKKKCAQLLNTLLILAKDGGAGLISQVSSLIRGLLGGQISPQAFTDKIQTVLNSKQNLNVLPFLQSMLPHVQKAYYAGELTFDGLNGPSVDDSTLQQSSASTSNQTAPSIPSCASPSTTTATISASTVPNSSGSLITVGGNTIFNSASIPGIYLVASPAMVQTVIPESQQRPAGSVSARRQYPAVGRQLISSGPGGAVQKTLPIPGKEPILANPVALARIETRSVRPQGKSSMSSKVAQHHPLALETGEKYREPEDDINDVAAMGGVSLLEESQNIMASSVDILSTETRSCGEEEEFLFINTLSSRIRAMSAKHGLQESGPEVASLVSHATCERLKDLLEKLALIAEHRMEPLRNNPLYEPVSDVRSQLRFLKDLSQRDSLRREEQEKEMVLKMAKSRSSKLGDTEQQKIKERAKELQIAEQEEMRNRDANAAAHLALAAFRKRPAATSGTEESAIWPQSQAAAAEQEEANIAAQLALAKRKRPAAAMSDDARQLNGNTAETLFRTQTSRPRFKRVNLRDLQILLSQSRQSNTSQRLFYK